MQFLKIISALGSGWYALLFLGGKLVYIGNKIPKVLIHSDLSATFSIINHDILKFISFTYWSSSKSYNLFGYFFFLRGTSLQFPTHQPVLQITVHKLWHFACSPFQQRVFFSTFHQQNTHMKFNASPLRQNWESATGLQENLYSLSVMFSFKKVHLFV